MQTADELIDDVRSLLAGDPVFMAGSLVAEQTYGKSNSHHDLDIFCPTQEQLVATVQKMLMSDYIFADRFERVWVRWRTIGLGKWHTHSMRLISPLGVETNLVFKLSEGHATTSLAQVLESFDFGLLATGYDLRENVYRDMRSYLFPDIIGSLVPLKSQLNGLALPMMPNKRANWRNGFISQYNLLREAGRYVKYVNYGYDMSLVRDDLSTGYWSAASYYTSCFEEEKQQLGKIAELLAVHVEDNNIDELEEATKQIDYNDSLDAIMEALE